jgi:hypothetical protein
MMMQRRSTTTLDQTIFPLDQLYRATRSPAIIKKELIPTVKFLVEYDLLVKEMTREAKEFCDMLNEHVAAACPLRTVQVNQALQMTRHALGSEFKGDFIRKP